MSNTATVGEARGQTLSLGQAGDEPFMGSATTLIAAKLSGRIALGIELNPAYVDVAVKR